MFYFFKPKRDAINRFVAAQETAHLSYADVCGSQGSPPKGYKVDHNRIQLGHGPEVFARAKRAIDEWKMFDMPWIQLCWPDSPIRVGGNVAVLVRHWRFWSLNACRIVYLQQGNEPFQKYGFAYGTLADHGERGEERFTVEYMPDGSVWYDLYAFSRPGLWAALGYPVTRYPQKRFASDSKMAMWRAVQTY